MPAFEPDVLRLGRLFDARVKGDYPRGAEDLTSPPAPRTVQRATPPNRQGRRRGYIDLLLEGRDEESGLPFQVVVEVKNTDWDAQHPSRVRPNIGRHRRQVWGYLEPILERCDAGELAWAQAAIIYPRRPRTAGRSEEISDALDEYGISVVWYDEIS